MIPQLLLSVLIAAQPASYLARTAEAVENAMMDVPALQEATDAAAKKICNGGKLFAGGNPSLISEMSGRAGGIMLTTALGDTPPAANDAVMFFADAEHPLPAAVADSGATVLLFGANSDNAKVQVVPPHAEDWGLSPTLSMAIQGWLFNAELVASCTRLDKMPVLYESIGLYGGVPRMNEFQAKGIFFHPENHVPRLNVTDLSSEYYKRVAAMLRRCEKEQRAEFDRAAQWSARAMQNSSQPPLMYSMGHLFPDEIAKTAIGKHFRSEVWNAGFSYIATPQDTYAKGDLVLHIGYQHAPLPMLEQAREVGARAVYVSVVKDRDFPTGPNVVWIDPMWPFADACVPIPGYDIPGFAASGVVNAAIAWEIDRLAQLVSTR